MRERTLIFGGLALFLFFFTYPMWHALASGTRPQQPKLQLPTNAKQCVEPVEFMRSSHMQLLISWRENAVRDHSRQYHSSYGKNYDRSLTRTCLGQCHSRKEFCDRCHTYSGVSAPYCWQCHNEPRLVAGGTR